MTSQSVNIGIDLGTTNSAVAVNLKGDVQIVKNAHNSECTPSVFAIDPSGKKLIGQKAYESCSKDAAEDNIRNTKFEIKRLMGTKEEVRFERNNTSLTPEEISAEILKSLRADVTRAYPYINANAAVITVPASFSTLQAEATRRAGNLAGLEYVSLLQEPIAASMAYEFAHLSDHNILVYDLGGGTFDVVLVSSKNGVLTVLAHNGDNFLGGKDFDSLIIFYVIMPRLMQDYSLSNFNKGNPAYRIMFAKLKYYAELAKMRLSGEDRALIEIEDLGRDDKGKEISLNIELSSKTFEDLIGTSIDKTIEMASRTIKDSGVSKRSIKKTVLVGGPTQIPYIRTRLEKELGVPVDFSADPFTVVARGAAIFASSQKVPLDILQRSLPATKKTQSVIDVELNYESLTSDTEQLVTGTVQSLKNTDAEYFVQIINDRSTYTGPKIKLNKGTFSDRIKLDKKGANTYSVYLYDDKGKSLAVFPSTFTITYGLSVAGAPIPHSIGISIIDKGKSVISDKVIEEFDTYFPKGSILPLSKTKKFHTANKLVKSDAKNELMIVVYEGENSKPENNTFICNLALDGKDLPYTLPENTDIEISIKVSESRELTVEYYLPIIDKRGNCRATIIDEDISVERLVDELAMHKDRYKEIKKNCTVYESSQIDTIIESITSGLKNVSGDEDDKRKIYKQMKDLRMLMSKAEKEKPFSEMIAEYNENLEELDRILSNTAESNEKTADMKHFEVIRSEAKKAISEKNKELLSGVIERVFEMRSRLLFSNPVFLMSRFNLLISSGYEFEKPFEAKNYITMGQKLIEDGNLIMLRDVISALTKLLPYSEKVNIDRIKPGIKR